MDIIYQIVLFGVTRIVHRLVIRLGGAERQRQSPVGCVCSPAFGELLEEHVRRHPIRLINGDSQRFAFARSESACRRHVRGGILGTCIG